MKIWKKNKQRKSTSLQLQVMFVVSFLKNIEHESISLLEIFLHSLEYFT